MTEYLVVGAGPAGMTAALTAVRLGIKPLVIDNRPEPGGNIYAFLGSSRKHRNDTLDHFGPTYKAGLPLLERFNAAVDKGAVEYYASTKLWHIDQKGSFAASGPKGNISGQAKRVCLATGAQERPTPIDGWTLPGVMGVGAAQIKLKSGGELPKGPIVIIGTGPLPLLLSKQLNEFGYNVKAFIEAEGSRRWLINPLALLGAAASPKVAIDGIKYLLARRLAKIPVYSQTNSIKIVGKDRARKVQFKSKEKQYEIDAALVLVHDGIIPNANPLRCVKLNEVYCKKQDSFETLGDKIVQAAGDAGYILGADAAKLTGEIATLKAFNKTVPTRLKTLLWKQRKFRNFLDNMFPAVKFGTIASPKTTICRCELATAESIRKTISKVGPDANRVKTTLRSGMGPCQGRFCNASIVDLINDELGVPYSDITPQRCRSPILPTTFADIASLNKDGDGQT